MKKSAVNAGSPDHTRLARAQLTLVEHALCPLDTAASLRPGLLFETTYLFSDKHRNRKEARARVGALDGLSAHDELYLWGLLSLALAQPEPRAELVATPYWCLRHLGAIDADKRGGREFELFRAAIRRLAGVRYQNDAFYDPVRGEHRQVSFGFLNYSLPLDSQSSRAWRFAWDPIFFEFAQATGGALSFDLALYRELDAASRRFYLYLKKLFWRTEETGWLELRHLAVDVLGFSATLQTKHLKLKVRRCIEQLAAHELLVLDPQRLDPFEKHGKGNFRVQLRRGPAFDRVGQGPFASDSPLVDPLRAIGFDNSAIQRILGSYAHRSIEQWADITLAARERHGESFFKRSPQAYFLDNVKAVATGNRTPPDWWRELRKQELEAERKQEASKARVFAQEKSQELDFETYLRTEARDAFMRLTDSLVQDLTSRGQAEQTARANAERIARTQLAGKFRQARESTSPGQFARPAGAR